MSRTTWPGRRPRAGLGSGSPAIRTVKTHTDRLRHRPSPPVGDGRRRTGSGEYLTAANSSGARDLAAGPRSTRIFESGDGFVHLGGGARRHPRPRERLLQQRSSSPRTEEPVWEGHLEALRISQTGEIQDSNAHRHRSNTGDLRAARHPRSRSGTPRFPAEGRTRQPNDLHDEGAATRVNFDDTTGHRRRTSESPELSDLHQLSERERLNGVDTVSGTPRCDHPPTSAARTDSTRTTTGTTTTQMREIVFGDIFHSTPRAIAAADRGSTWTEQGFADFYDDLRRPRPGDLRRCQRRPAARLRRRRVHRLGRRLDDPGARGAPTTPRDSGNESDSPTCTRGACWSKLKQLLPQNAP